MYNKRGMIVYCNKAANDWLGISEGDTFEKVRERLEGLGIQVEREKERILEDLLLSLDGGGKIRLKQYIQRDKTGATVAGIFLLTDVGEYYERLRQNRELAVSAQKLAIEQERNRIAQKVHDTAGHTLTMIQSLVRLARVEWERSQSVSEEEITRYGELTQLAGERRFEKISEKEAVREGETSSGEGRMEEYLSQAQELAVEGIRELRISINQLRQGTEGELVTQGVYHLAQRVKELDVEVSVQGTDGLSYSHLSTVVYECLREAITNCLKYAHASHMDVILKFEENGLRVYIFDDGQGCQSIVEDNGLRGIRDRVTEAGGQVRILSSEGEGFQIYIWLPMEQKP